MKAESQFLAGSAIFSVTREVSGGSAISGNGTCWLNRWNEATIENGESGEESRTESSAHKVV